MVGLPTSPGRSFCKACGRDLAELPPSRSGQHRQTCDDACRQAYHRGQRAPIAGVVDAESIERLSRLHAPLPTAEERAVAREARAMQSIAEYG